MFTLVRGTEKALESGSGFHEKMSFSLNTLLTHKAGWWQTQAPEEGAEMLRILANGSPQKYQGCVSRFAQGSTAELGEKSKNCLSTGLLFMVCL